MRTSIVQMLAGVGLLLAPSPSIAQQIIAPVSATINSGGPGFGLIANTFNQSGLSSNYVAGTTNFNSYLGTSPAHAYQFSGNEWFSNFGVSSATVTYDFGTLLAISGMALWNEDAAGIGFLNVLTSSDGITFASLFSATPPDNPINQNYGATIFTFGAISTRYARLEMSRCPQGGNEFEYCAIGEVAFRAAEVNSAVPESSTWAMMLLGFGAIGGALRSTRRRRQKPVLQAG
ncbi:MAG: PEPxxWA-CTERM sorting domain-containing protein [Sphingomonas bacterium]|nr:PEPxxWA-CTERM sorting domain-containing protein [Sphingomonas bacterium]